MQAIKSYETYSNIINSCSRFQIIGKRWKMLLLCIYAKPGDEIKKSFKWKDQGACTKVGQGSGLIMRVAKLIGNKNWKSAWLILRPDRNLCYTIQRIHWQIPENNLLARLPSYQQPKCQK